MSTLGRTRLAILGTLNKSSLVFWHRKAPWPEDHKQMKVWHSFEEIKEQKKDGRGAWEAREGGKEERREGEGRKEGRKAGNQAQLLETFSST